MFRRIILRDENPNQKALLPELEKRREITISEIKKLKCKAKHDIEKIVTDFARETGLVPELKPIFKTRTEIDGTVLFNGFELEFEVKI